MKKVVWCVVLVLASFVRIASAQDKVSVVVTPIIESGSYSRTFTYDVSGLDYVGTVEKSATVQKGVAVEFRGKGRWSSKIRFTTGSVGTSEGSYVFADGTSQSRRLVYAAGTTQSSSNTSRSIGVTEQYSRGFLAYRFGVGYRLLDQTGTLTSITGSTTDSYQSEVADTFVGPQFGITANRHFGRFAAIASLDASPWVHHSVSSEFRSQNFGNSNGQASATSKGLDLDLGLNFRIVNNIGLTGGWRYSAISTSDSSLIVGNPYGTKMPMKDSWKGVYVGLQIMK